MGVFSNITGAITGLWAKDEAWVLGFIQGAKSGVAITVADLAAFWSWLGSHSSDITQDAMMITTAINSLRSVGVPIPAAVGVAVSGMNLAVSGMNAAFTAQNAGANTIEVVTAGYTAAKLAQVAHAQAAIALVGAPTKAG